jgi:hypothetical protein
MNIRFQDVILFNVTTYKNKPLGKGRVQVNAVVNKCRKSHKNKNP